MADSIGTLARARHGEQFVYLNIHLGYLYLQRCDGVLQSRLVRDDLHLYTN
jgi:hypothetical protein